MNRATALQQSIPSQKDFALMPTASLPACRPCPAAAVLRGHRLSVPFNYTSAFQLCTSARPARRNARLAAGQQVSDASLVAAERQASPFPRDQRSVGQQHPDYTDTENSAPDAPNHSAGAGHTAEPNTATVAAPTPKQSSNSEAAASLADPPPLMKAADASSPLQSPSVAAATVAACAVAVAAAAESATPPALTVTAPAPAAATEPSVAEPAVFAAAPDSAATADLPAVAAAVGAATAAEAKAPDPVSVEPLPGQRLSELKGPASEAEAEPGLEPVSVPGPFPVSVPGPGRPPSAMGAAEPPPPSQPPPPQQRQQQEPQQPRAEEAELDAAAFSASTTATAPQSTSLVLSDARSDLAPAATAGGSETGSESGSDEDAPLDDTAVTISVLAAAAAAATAAEAGAQHPYPYAPRGNTRRHRNTSTWELRSPARRPPRVVAFEGAGGLAELQALISSVTGPTIIDLQGRVLTLEPASAPAPAASPPSAAPPPLGAARPEAPAPPPRPTKSTALVAPGAFSVPGWSTAVDAVSERSRMLPSSLLSSSSTAAALASRRNGPPPQQQLGADSGAAAASGLLQLHRDDVTLANGTLQLHRDCRLLVTGRRVTLRRVEVVDSEAAAWWRQATAMPASCLQTLALITVAPPTTGSGSGTHHYQHHLHGAASRPLPGATSYSGGGGEGPSLELDDCSVVASGRDRDLLRADGGGVAVTARYSRLRGGANSTVATLQSSMNLDCCVLEGYAAAGVVALGSSARLVGSRLLGAAGAIVGLQAAAGAHVSALGCFLKSHASNVECLAGSIVDLQGCVLSRPDCRYGLTVHPAAAAAVAAGPHSPPPVRGNPPPPPRRSSALPAPPTSTSSTSSAPSPAAGGRARLVDCEVAHAVQVGSGGELELERCTFAVRPAPADLPRPPLQITSDPALAAKLTAAVATAAAAASATARGRRARGGEGDRGSAFGGSVATAGALRVVGCRVGTGGEGEAVVVEAASEARVHVSSSPGVLIRRLGGSGAP